jgi:hypothetical protein
MYCYINMRRSALRLLHRATEHMVIKTLATVAGFGRPARGGNRYPRVAWEGNSRTAGHFGLPKGVAVYGFPYVARRCIVFGR